MVFFNTSPCILKVLPSLDQVPKPEKSLLLASDTRIASTNITGELHLKART